MPAVGGIVDTTNVDDKINGWLKFKDWFNRKGQTPYDNITAVLGHYDELPSGNIEFWKEWHFTHNIVTNDGDEFYARRAQGTADVATNANFVSAKLALATTANAVAEGNDYGDFGGSSLSDVIASSGKNVSSGYAKISDNDGDNSANSNVRTLAYKFDYATGDFNHTSITNGAVYDSNVSSPDANTKILTHFQFSAAFAKTANDTLKVFVNHTFNAA